MTEHKTVRCVGGPRDGDEVSAEQPERWWHVAEGEADGVSGEYVYDRTADVFRWDGEKEPIAP